MSLRQSEPWAQRATRLGAVSVDLDEIGCYFAVHGLSGAAPAPSAVYEIALARVRAWADTLEIPLTLFVVGADLHSEENQKRLSVLYAAGNELGNHSLDHRYDLSRLAPEEQRRQVEEGARSVQHIAGPGAVGFRAPGYVVTDKLLEVVRKSGALYDSSVFPCPLYYAAKGAAIGLKRLVGKRSRSLIDSLSVLTAPTRPYRLGSPYTTSGHGLWELPIQVTPTLRLPFIGTALTALGEPGSRLLTRSLSSEEFVNLELHGIDFLDQTDGLAALVPHQPDLAIPWKNKAKTLSAVVQQLQADGRSFVRLAEVVGYLEAGAALTGGATGSS